MDGFSYHNIFDTKGIEYLAIITFFLILLPFWLLLNKQITVKIGKALTGFTAGILNIPHGIFYSKNHTWTHLERNGNAKIGLNGLLIHIAGDIKVNLVKVEGEQIGKGDLVAEIGHNGKTLKILSPISGTIVKHNPVLVENNSIIQNDPYGKGWIYSVKPSNWIEEIPNCYMAEDAIGWLSSEIVRYKDFLASSTTDSSNGNTQIILQDGGELAENSLLAMPVEVWHNFQNEFLNLKN
jgi:glycine cleavage system H protein